MSKLDFIYKRKSIRDYKDAVVPKEDILKMLDAATHAPSQSINKTGILLWYKIKK